MKTLDEHAIFEITHEKRVLITQAINKGSNEPAHHETQSRRSLCTSSICIKDLEKALVCSPNWRLRMRTC